MNYDRETAVAIGHHFWKCDSDEAAEQCGADAAKDVAKRVATAPTPPELDCRPGTIMLPRHAFAAAGSDADEQIAYWQRAAHEIEQELTKERDAALADAAAMRKALSTVTDAMVDAAQNAFFAGAHEPHGMHDPSAAWGAAIRAAYDAATAKGTG